MNYTSITGFINTINSPKYIVSKLEYYDTPYGVPSKGFVAEYYNDPESASSSTFDPRYRVDIGRSNILSYDWSIGSPAGVSTTDFFKAKYYGYFYAKFTGTYTFRLNKERTDYARFFFNRTRTVTVPSGVSQYISSDIKINDWLADAGNPTGNFQSQETIEFNVALTEGNWYPFLLEYAERTKEAYISMQYLEPNNRTSSNGEYSDNDNSASNHLYPVSHYKIVSAGVSNFSPDWNGASNASFINPIIITGVNTISLSKSYNESNILTFSVPLLAGVLTTSGTFGYRYDPSNNLYYDDNSNSYLRQGRLVKYYAGYSSNGTLPSSYDYIQRFEGIITDIDSSRSQKNDQINVKCQDIIYHAINSIEENYPDKISYLNFGFTSSNTAGEPNGQTKPTAYDGWPLVDAVRDLYIKAGVDPTKLYGRRKHLNRDGSYSWGDYFIEDRKIVLKRKNKYGNPNETSIDNSDDKYIWGTEFGKQIFDKISKMADLYGYVTEVSSEGYPTCNSVNSPILYTPDDDWDAVGTWSTNYDLKADGGTYLSTDEEDAYVDFIVEGSAFSVNLIKDNKAYTNYNTSSWSIVHNEFPVGTRFDSSQRPLARHGILFGRTGSKITIFGADIYNYVYVNGSFYFTPQSTIIATGLKYRLESFKTSSNYGIVSDVYLGKTTDYTNLVNSSLVASNYVPGNFINGIETINFASDIILTGGTTYGVRFITKDTNTPSSDSHKTENILYRIQSCSINGTGNGIHNSYTTNTAVVTNNSIIITTGTITYKDSESNITVYPNLTIYGKNESGGNDINGRSEISIYTYPGNTLLSGWIVDNWYNDKENSSSEYRYPSDGADFTGENPCKFYIRGYDIGTLTSGNVRLPYGSYKIRVKNLNTTALSSGTKITSIESYPIDPFNPVWIFDSKSNIKTLGVTQSIDDIRNDVIVVGDLIGAFKEYGTNDVVNKNNPSYQYIYSRATDISSINNPDSLNNVGKKKPFIIYEPSIVDQKHADWMAQAVLYRYSSMKKLPSWESYGIPFLETNDSVIVIDDQGNGVVSDSRGNPFQWTVNVDETISKTTYNMNIVTTPYDPWGSFTQYKNPDISNFGNQPFINIRMTDSNDSIRGFVGNDLFDVYESESGNRLRIKYDQVIDGDIIVKVMSKSILGFAEEKPVAYLVGALEDGIEIPEYREWGTDYTLYWDCVDQLGSTRKNLILFEESSDYISSFDQPGFFSTSGDYFVRFSIYPRDRVNSDGTYTKQGALTVNTNKLLVNYNSNFATDLGIDLINNDDIFEGLWRIKWGDPLDIYMTVSGQRSVGLDRNIMYHPDNVFYSDEYDSYGPKFTFIASGINGASTIGRVVYYKVDVEHLWAMGYNFTLRSDALPYTGAGNRNTNPLHTDWRHSTNAITDWKTAFEYAIKGYNGLSRYGIEDNQLDSRYSDSTYKYWYLPAHIYAEAGTDIVSYLQAGDNWQDENDHLIMDDKYILSQNGSEWIVHGWFNTPYTDYVIKDYIPQSVHKYSDENKIEFYYNPELPIGGGYIFDSLPDMTDSAYDNIRKTLTLMAYYNGKTNQQDDNKKLKLTTSHCFQVKTTIWDSTGRLLKNNVQKIVRTADPHTHSIYNANPSYLTKSHSHSDPDSFFIMNPTNWGSPSRPQGISERNVFYETRVSGEAGFTNNSRYKYGIGYCNITGSTNYGLWTWHGYWKSDVYSSVNQTLGFNHVPFASTNHWFRQSGDKYPIFHWGQEKAPGGIWYIDIKDDDDEYIFNAVEQTAIQDGVYYSHRVHAHPFIYEGINSGTDYDGVLEQAVTDTVLYITGISNPTGTYKPVIATILDEADIWSSNPRYQEVSIYSNFPNIWYYSNNNLPWYETGDPTDAYWTKFLIDSGLKFYHGGWSRYLSDSER